MIDFSKQDKKWLNAEYCLRAVRQNGLNLAYVHNQTPLIVYHALQRSPYLNVDLIHISKEEWNKFKNVNPELFI
jgi:hypothetical protein